jgi:hypothetical protein
MAITLFKDTTYSVSLLMESIGRGEVALPDIQRPFVWQAAKVRDLLDSMYKGFPVGYLLFWETGVEPGARQIGGGTQDPVARLLIVDGQQRLTSLFAVMTGREVMKEDYSMARIRIGFRPIDAIFTVTDAAVERDPEFIPDVSVLWESEGGRRKAVRGYLKGLAAKRGELDQDEEDRLEDAIDRLYDLRNYPFKVVELSPEVDEEQVAEVFVRINSEGVTLNQADFILTLMSVFWEKGRHQLEDFSRACKTPSLSGASPFNWYIQPSPAQLLRVCVAVAFRRAVLRLAYSLLRGKDLDTGRVDPDRRTAQFAQLQAAQERVLDLTNWHEYLLCLERAGFRGSKMITSENAVIFSYALWLMGRADYGVSLDRLREVIARWFFMAQTTGRYTGSFESQFEQDASKLAQVATGDAHGFCRALDRIVSDTLGNDYWTITLPNELSTSAAKSPALMAYIAALNILDAEPLLSTGKVRARLDPAVTSRKGIERHHVFPKAFLKRQGTADTKRINQIANMALVEWSDNIDISDEAPSRYWPAQIAQKNISALRLTQQQYWHALPDGWETLPYEEFLLARRRLMGTVVRDAFAKLTEDVYAPTYPATGPPTGHSAPITREVTVADLVSADLLPEGTTLLAAGDAEVAATVLADGKLSYSGNTYGSPSAVAAAASGASRNGWTYWIADLADGHFSLSNLRETFLSSRPIHE